jgi:hypothetical protein
MPRTYLTFGDIEGKLDVLRVECTKCEHRHKRPELPQATGYRGAARGKPSGCPIGTAWPLPAPRQHDYRTIIRSVGNSAGAACPQGVSAGHGWRRANCDWIRRRAATLEQQLSNLGLAALIHPRGGGAVGGFFGLSPVGPRPR